MTPGTVLPAHTPLSAADQAALSDAVTRLVRSRGLVLRFADLVDGAVGELAAASWRRLRLPSRLVRQSRQVAHEALRLGFDVALTARGRTEFLGSANTARLIAATSGAAAGFAGFAGFLPDATATTFLIMRNIATIAEAEGEDLDDMMARQACLEVLAFGAPGFAPAEGEDGEAAYWSTRLLLHGRPLSVLMAEIAAGYGIRLSQRLVASMVPVLGAAAGALVNVSFLDHYRNVARVHFTIRRLERAYGPGKIRAEARRLAEGAGAA